MIVSESKGFIFIHNPKAGGMSFRTILKRHDTTDEFFLEWVPYPERGCLLDRAHLTLEQLRAHHRDVYDMMERVFTFGFVRDPYQRYFSALSQHLKLTTPLMRRAVMSDPECFYAVANRIARHVFDPDELDRDVKRIHFRRQTDFFYIDGARRVEAVAQIERPETWDARAAELLGGRDVERRNETAGVKRGRYEPERLDAEALARINEFYAPDFEAFGYPMLTGPAA